MFSAQTRFLFPRYWSIRIQLTCLYLGIFGTTLIVFCSFLYQSFILNQQKEFDASLYNHAVDISQGITVGRFGNLIINPDLLSMGGRIFPFPSSTVYIQILTLNGSEIARSRNLGQAHLPLSHDDLKLLSRTRAVFNTIDIRDLKIKPTGRHSTQFRLLTALSPGQSDQNFILQVAVSEEFLNQTTRDLHRFLWFGIPLTLFSAALGGLYLSRKALKPVRELIERANRLSPNRLSERIPVPTVKDEIRSLALTLNAFLDRLQNAFESQERFIADASHELKTPLAILKGELDVFRSRPRTPDETSLFVNNCRQEINHLSRVVEDLLILARVDAGLETVVKEVIHLEDVILEVISKLEPLAKKKNIKIRLNLNESQQLDESSVETYTLRADSDLLRILFKNLVENAIKYSPENTVVEIRLSTDSHWVKVEVLDQGPGIPEEKVKKIFDRFYRGASSEETSATGAGLGLAIVQKIIEVHQGTIEVNSRLDGGSIFKVQIKKF